MADESQSQPATKQPEHVTVDMLKAASKCQPIRVLVNRLSSLVVLRGGLYLDETQLLDKSINESFDQVGLLVEVAMSDIVIETLQQLLCLRKKMEEKKLDMERISRLIKQVLGVVDNRVSLLTKDITGSIEDAAKIRTSFRAEGNNLCQVLDE